jgi:Ca2+-transporting ATPase
VNSELGRIAGLLGSAAPSDDRTPLQKRLAVVGRSLVWFCLGIVALMFVLGLLRGTAPLELFMTSVSLAVAAVPESLPAAVTVALGLGVLRMSRRKALVRSLPAVETLGSTNVICTDKTGTLTAGEMTVRELYAAGTTFEVTGEGYGPRGEVLLEGKAAPASLAPPLLLLAEIFIGSNNAELILEDGMWKVIGDPTEAALLLAGQKAGVLRDELEMRLPRHHEIPFDSDRKRRTVVRLGPGARLRAHVNGAPDVLLRHCTHILTEEGVQPLTAEERDRLAVVSANMADRALRVLGSAYRDLEHAEPHHLTAESVERDLIFAGLAGMYDPPRAGVKEGLLKCRGAGIRVVMITGDHPQTARAIARELGIREGPVSILSGAELDALSDGQLESTVKRADVYARVTPTHKLRIVRAWQASGAVVAMTGDGVNDAPAIKGADIGIAMGCTGTEVTKQAADMVITDDDFSTIVAAVEEGRGIFDNIRKSLLYLFAGGCGELMLMMVAVLAGLPAPLLPIHLLWINLVTDGLPALCLATGSVSPNVMKALPLARGAALTDRRFVRSIVITGLLTAAVTFGVFLYSLHTASVEVARTRAFATLVFAELFRALAARNENVPVWRIPFKANPRLLAVIGFCVPLQLFLHQSQAASEVFHTTLMPFGESLMLVALGALPLLLLQLRHSKPINTNAGLKKA